MDFEEELKALRQRLIKGDISEELYRELKSEIEAQITGAGATGRSRRGFFIHFSLGSRKAISGISNLI